MSTVALAYAAGFLDADGHVGFYRQAGKTYQPSFAIVNANISTLEFIQEQIGGKIYERIPRNTNHSTTYCLQITNKAGISRALELLIPFLVGKKETATLVKRFCDNRIEANPRNGCNKPPTTEDLDIITRVKALGAMFYKRPVRSTA